ncbi:DNA-binding anti-repressor SinI [Virgibacillus profundi]|nr:DNA-binding anti-repressor SinI [Virgibacillus profundi]
MPVKSLTYDQEWVYLITLAKESGLSKSEVLQFLKLASEKEKTMKR